jgi:hypothetical protein
VSAAVNAAIVVPVSTGNAGLRPATGRTPGAGRAPPICVICVICVICAICAICVICAICGICGICGRGLTGRRR